MWGADSRATEAESVMQCDTVLSGTAVITTRRHIPQSYTFRKININTW